MKKTKAKSQTKAIVTRTTTKSPAPAEFEEVLALIAAARFHVVATVNTALIDPYWTIGRYISRKVAQDGWGHGTITALADYIRSRLPNARGFSAQNLWRMRQFFDSYQAKPKLSPLVRELPWTHNLLKPHENPAIGLLLCATRDQEVVEYALSRSASPALIAEYQTRLPDKQLLRAKLHEFYESAQERAALPEVDSSAQGDKKSKKRMKRRKK
jgi:hypothetical protein